MEKINCEETCKIGEGYSYSNSDVYEKSIAVRGERMAVKYASFLK